MVFISLEHCPLGVSLHVLCIYSNIMYLYVRMYKISMYVPLSMASMSPHVQPEGQYKEQLSVRCARCVCVCVCEVGVCEVCVCVCVRWEYVRCVCVCEVGGVCV